MSSEYSLHSLDYELSALESLINEIDENDYHNTSLQEENYEELLSSSFDKTKEKIDYKYNSNSETQVVNNILDRAKVKIQEKYNTIEETQEALNAVIAQADKINAALAEMAKCSKEYANGEIDDKLRCVRIQNIMDDIRIPVKELQIQMGQNCDKEGPVTEKELRDFRNYVEGFINALRDRIKTLGGVSDVSTLKTYSIFNDDIDSDDDADSDALEFTHACESLMVHVPDNDESMESMLESLLNDITEL